LVIAAPPPEYSASPVEGSGMTINARVLRLIPFLLILAVCSLVAAGCSSDEPVLPSEARAAIVDQISSLNPDPDFIQKATGCLNNMGLPVDYFQGDQITVDLYRRLPASGYKIVVFRTHSGLMSNGDRTEQKTCLFTNQPYSRMSCIMDQLSGRVGQARLDDYPPQFSIDGDFIENSTPAEFKRTLILMMGCSTLEKDDLARSFIKKGASVYIGWNQSVGYSYVDNATLVLLEQLSRENTSLQSAVTATMSEIGVDRVSGAELKYYPAQDGDATLAGLLY
jgi:hypothetical protein